MILHYSLQECAGVITDSGLFKLQWDLSVCGGAVCLWILVFQEEAEDTNVDAEPVE